ncbi:MAG TPA: hypothetical protein VFG01_12530 [Acidobacteriota bacterium]|nr:hypothetical protein [Acidobacteriota bacterium]
MGENKMENKGYQKDLEFIRAHLDKMKKPEPSHDFFEKTRTLCHSKLTPIKSSRIPKSIWIAIAVNIILIVFLMLPFTKALKSGQSLSPLAAGVMILMIQNAVMLFFAPVIIKKFKAKQKIDSNVLMI